MCKEINLCFVGRVERSDHGKDKFLGTFNFWPGDDLVCFAMILTFRFWYFIQYNHKQASIPTAHSFFFNCTVLTLTITKSEPVEFTFFVNLCDIKILIMNKEEKGF